MAHWMANAAVPGRRRSSACVTVILTLCQRLLVGASSDASPASRQMTWLHHKSKPTDTDSSLVLPRTVQISNNVGLCLDAGGTIIHLWNCDGGNHNQQWVQEPSGLMRNADRRSQCLSSKVQANADRDTIQVDACDENDSRQLWEFDVHTGHLMTGGVCLVESGVTRGSPIDLALCDNIDALQEWVLTIPELTTTTAVEGATDPVSRAQDEQLTTTDPVSTDTPTTAEHQTSSPATTAPVSFIHEVQTTTANLAAHSGVADGAITASWIFNSEGACLDASNGAVHMGKCVSTTDQAWFHDPATGLLRLGETQSPKCFDRGGSLHLWKCDASNANQRWAYDAGTRQIRAHDEDKCLDWGGEVHIWSCNSTNPDQRWRFLKFKAQEHHEEPGGVTTTAAAVGVLTTAAAAGVLTTAAAAGVLGTTLVDAAVTVEGGSEPGQPATDNGHGSDVTTANPSHHTMPKNTHDQVITDGTTGKPASAEHEAIAAGTTISPTAQSTPTHVKQSQLCLDASGAVKMWTCNATNPMQHWTFDNSRLKLSNTGCLTIDTQVHIAHCEADNPGQHIDFAGATGQIRTRDGKCLAAQEANVTGSLLTIGSCSSDNAQQHWNVGSHGDLIGNLRGGSKTLTQYGGVIAVVLILIVLIAMYAMGVFAKCSGGSDSGMTEQREMRAVKPEVGTANDEESSASLVQGTAPQQSSGPPPMPDGWHETVDEATGRTYFWHDSNPEATVTWSSALDGELPNGWHQTWDAERGCSYYWQESDPDKTTTWIKPATSP